ncbi:MAG TPA: anti-sigma factor antagonist [bacterium]|nr:anti-sigma factor antagonist [bacterium]
MQIAIHTVDDITVVSITGEIDGKTAPEAQQKILPLAAEKNNILLDLSGVDYISSAGLRLLLMVYRQVNSLNQRMGLAGVPELIRDVMTHTGFLRFFSLYDTVEDGVAALKK